MNKACFAMALHIHQPIGNFDSVLERAYRNCYLPFFNILFEYPSIKITLHISGCLLDYVKARHPEFLDKLRHMGKRRQVEFLGGAYYEPILIAIPPHDLSGQIRMMSDYIKSNFNQEPKGMWIPERVWAPRLSNLISKAGVKYCILDDVHLLNAGIPKENTYGFFLTGRKGNEVAVFPSDKKLRYIIPFSKPYEVIEYFTEVAKAQKYPLLVYGDDGEKFGEWPGTHKWVFEEGWLKNFFDELVKNESWLKLVHFSDYLNSHPALGRIEIPEASYEEMMEWAGGSWLNFLSKYAEANQLHKKMVYVSSKISRIDKKTKQKQIAEKAKRELYKGQCNCAYWHGVFGGLYLYHLRCAVYSHLIKAEKIADSVLEKNREEWLNVKELDFNMDGKKKYILENKTFSIYIDPSEGGIIKELDYKPLSFNLVNTLSRRKEAYHQKILDSMQQWPETKVATIHDDFRTAGPEFKNSLVYDRFGRYFLRGYFVGDKLDIDELTTCSFKEIGDFSTGKYSVERQDNSILLQRESVVFGSELRLCKRLSIMSKDELEVNCSIDKKGSSRPNVLFGLEFNITMPDLNAGRYHCYFGKKAGGDLNAKGHAQAVSSFGISDSFKELNIGFSASNKAAAVRYFPIKTVSQSERAYELNYQGFCLFPVWNLDFDKKRILDLKINITIGAKTCLRKKTAKTYMN